jgi:hypothetical protein
MSADAASSYHHVDPVSSSQKELKGCISEVRRIEPRACDRNRKTLKLSSCIENQSNPLKELISFWLPLNPLEITIACNEIIAFEKQALLKLQACH